MPQVHVALLIVPPIASVPQPENKSMCYGVRRHTAAWAKMPRGHLTHRRGIFNSIQFNSFQLNGSATVVTA